MVLETWQQYCPLRKTPDSAYCDVAMATLLVPVFSALSHCHYFDNIRTKKEWLLFGKPKVKRARHFHMKEIRKQTCCHDNIAESIIVLSFQKYVTGAKL